MEIQLPFQININKVDDNMCLDLFKILTGKDVSEECLPKHMNNWSKIGDWTLEESDWIRISSRKIQVGRFCEFFTLIPSKIPEAINKLKSIKE